MATKIKIAELSINSNEIIKSLQDTKNSIADLAKTQRDLVNAGEDNSKQFIKNEAHLKTLKTEYRNQSKALEATANASAKLKVAMDKEVKSLDDAKNNNTDLRKIRNQLNATTEEGAKAIAEINAKIDKNTDFVKDNTSALEKQKQGIGDYTGGIQKARLGAIAFGTALKAAGIGLVIAAIAKLTSVFGENQKVMDFVNTASNAFSIIMRDIVNFFVDNTGKVVEFFKVAFSNPQESVKKLGTLIKNNIIERFNSALEVLGFLGSAAKKFFSGDFAGALEDAKSAGTEFVDVLTGVDDSLAKGGALIDKVGDAVSKYGKDVLNTAKAQTELNNSVQIAIAQNGKLIEKYDRQAELQRQIRDDETKSFAERIAANDKLGEILNEQEKAMSRNAALMVQEAANNLALNDTIENRVALIDAEKEAAAVLAQVEGFRSEQIVNRIALNKEEVASEQEKLEALTALREEFLMSEQEAEIAAVERDAEKHIADLELLMERGEEKNELIKAIEAKRDADILKIKTDGAAEYLKVDQEILDKEKANASIRANIASALTGFLTGLLGDTIAAKIAAIAIDAAIQVGLVKITASSAMARNLAQGAAALPPPLNAATIALATAQNVGVAAGAAAAITGILTSSAIQAGGAVLGGVASGKKVFADGGFLQGASHAQGGIHIEAEGGEAIINKNSSAMYKPLLSAINEAGGGVKFAKGGMVGSTNVSGENGLIDYNALAGAMANMPNPVVSVDEISSVSNRVSVIQKQASF